MAEEGQVGTGCGIPGLRDHWTRPIPERQVVPKVLTIFIRSTRRARQLGGQVAKGGQWGQEVGPLGSHVPLPTPETTGHRHGKVHEPLDDFC